MKLLLCLIITQEVLVIIALEKGRETSAKMIILLKGIEQTHCETVPVPIICHFNKTDNS